MWIDTLGSDLPEHVIKHLDDTLEREDRTDRVWVNLETGSLVVLAANGGWSRAETSDYRLFLYAPGAAPYDITYAILGTPAVRFNSEETGSDTYNGVRTAAIEIVTERLSAWTFPSAETSESHGWN